MACKLCGNFFFILDLEKHIKTVHEGLKNHKCEKCLEEFSYNYQLREHVKSVHEGLKDYKLNSNDFTQMIQEYQTLFGTIHNHSNIDQFGVEETISKDDDIIIVNELNPNVSQESTKSIPMSKIVKENCKICKDEFKSIGHLETHMKNTHGILKSHKCGKCSKLFFNYNVLKQHIISVHEGIKEISVIETWKNCEKPSTLQGHPS